MCHPCKDQQTNKQKPLEQSKSPVRTWSLSMSQKRTLASFGTMERLSRTRIWKGDAKVLLMGHTTGMGQERMQMSVLWPLLTVYCQAAGWEEAVQNEAEGLLGSVSLYWRIKVRWKTGSQLQTFHWNSAKKYWLSCLWLWLIFRHRELKLLCMVSSILYTRTVYMH